MTSINQDKIAELKELDDDGSDSVLKELIGLFLDSTPPKLKKILESFNLKDYSTAKKEAHSLRSSALNLGAEGLALLAKEIEYANDESDLEVTMGGAVKKLNDEFQLVKSELEKLL